MEKSKDASLPIRERNFNLVTYVSKMFIETVLVQHECKANYIWHDKDDEVPHWHICLRLKNATTASAVLKWFKDGCNDDGVIQNTLIEYCNNVPASLRYLIHLDNPDKHQYSPDEVFHWGNGAIQDFYDAISSGNPELDSATRSVLFIRNGGTVSDACLKFGRDFIYHYKYIKDILYDWDCNYLFHDKPLKSEDGEKDEAEKV